MPHIPLPESPGITSLLMQFPETGQHLRAFTETLLRGPSSLTPAERELIAMHVSALNDCTFCTRSHAAAARHLYGDGERGIVEQVRANIAVAPLSEKLRALLDVAGHVARSGRNVSAADIQGARDAGADDRAIHDTVLIAAAFCMFNRYVDGLATWTPEDEGMYDMMGERLARQGYLAPQP